MEDALENTKYAFQLPVELCTTIYCCILEETLDQLFILIRLSNSPKNKNPFFERNQEKLDRKVSDRIKTNLETFDKNFNFIERTIKELYEELKSDGTYHHFTEVVNALKKSHMDAENLKKQVLLNKEELQRLERVIIEEENSYHWKIAESMAEIGKIKDEIEDFQVESEIKLEYIESWQQSKIEMNTIFLERKEEERMTDLKKIDADTYREGRVHQEIIAAYSEMELDLQYEIENWKEKYEKDIKEMEAKIEVLKGKREEQNEATRNLKDIYLKRQREINDYKLYKIKQEEKQLELKKRNDAATKIQAWWRGTMVRKGFGKFRKKKDKKGKKKEKQEKK